jgi:radical SAM superfamily enzyme YgiQ (UPF0313 family)
MTYRILLSDLTYTQQTISSDVMPAAIGSVAAYLRAETDADLEIHLFKYPEELIRCLEDLKRRELPVHIAGFSHYVWNRNLSLAFADVVERHFDDAVIVFGGPNFPTDLAEQESFLRAHPAIDVHIVKEGEKPFAKLVAGLIAADFDVDGLSEDLPNLAYIDGAGRFCASETVERTLDLEALPSPYTAGLLDEFFDGKLLPIMQTNRGCPFMCTFCTEGMGYWSKVYKNKQDKIDREIDYIAGKMVSLGAAARSDLHIADSNFGMYKEDIETAKSLRRAQERYGYPRYINVATGKNKKERVLEVAGIVNGAMKLAGSVQSLDETVLKNIKRSNIGADQIMDLGKSADAIGANSYSEVILGLPGDTKEAHFATCKTLVEAGFNTICMYQFMILPGTESGSAACREEYGMTTRWRFLPRCYGYYDVLGEEINSAEIEEICVAHNSLSFADYLDCRKMNFIVNVFYNDGVFRELLKFLTWEGVSLWDWLVEIYKGVDGFDGWAALLGDFLDETERELWPERAALAKSAASRDNIKKYIDGRLGGNLMFKYKGLSMTSCLGEVAEIARITALRVLRAGPAHTPEKARFIDDVIKYNLCCMSDIFTREPTGRLESFTYDIAGFSRETEPGDIARFKYPHEREIGFAFDDEQIAELRNYLDLFGDSAHGISRILSRVYIRKLFRRARIGETDGDVESFMLSKGQATLSGLNEFD